MSQVKLRFAITSVVAILLVAGFYTVVFFLFQPEFIQTKLISRLEEITRSEIRFGDLKLHYFPSPRVQLSDISIEQTEFKKIYFKADDLVIYPGLASLFMGKKKIKKIGVSGGVVDALFGLGFAFDQMHIENTSLILFPVQENAPMHFEIQGDLEGVKDSFSAKGQLIVPILGEWDMTPMSYDGQVNLHNLPVRILQKRIRGQRNARLKDGLLTTNLKAKKGAGSDWWELTGHANLEQFIYEVRHKSSDYISPQIDSDLKFQVGWNPRLEELDLKEASFKLPFGHVEMSGHWLLGTGEVKSVQISANDIVMESLPHYYLPLKEAIPFNIGFSGQSSLELSMEGTLDHLTLHGTWDLTPTLLTYTRYFNKPKDLALRAVFDCLIKDGHQLEGDYSFRLHDASFKGTVNSVDLRTGDGQMNIITNKFEIAQLQPLLVPLEGYGVGGNLKLLVNLKGNFGKLNEAEKLLNITLEQGRLRYAGGNWLENISLALDYSPLMLDIKKLDFSIDNALLTSSTKIFDFPKKPTIESKIEAENFKFSLFLETLFQVSGKWLEENDRQTMISLRDRAVAILPIDKSLQDFKMTMISEEGQLKVPDLSFKIYGGLVSSNVEIEYQLESPKYSAELSIIDLDLSLMTSHKTTDLTAREAPMKGLLFLDGQFSGSHFGSDVWPDYLEGQGEWTIRDGEFYNFDILGAIGEIQEFSDINLLISETTPFSRLQSNFVLRDRRFVSNNMRLESDQLYVESQGDLTFEGNLNYRLNVYLSSKLTDALIAPLFDLREVEGDKQFGPIPLLLAGRLEKVELQLSASALAGFLDAVKKRNWDQVFRDLRVEDNLWETVERR